MLSYTLLLTSSVFICVNCRGPHHPRGEVVRHHVHYRPTRGTDQKLLQDKELLHDTAHLEEHLEEVIEKPDLSQMTDEELDFYYFQVHDTDKNSKLDGLEILQAIMHTDHHDEDEDGDGQKEDNTAYFIGWCSKYHIHRNLIV